MGFDMWRHRARANRRIFEACFPYMYRNEYKKIKQGEGRARREEKRRDLNVDDNDAGRQ